MGLTLFDYQYIVDKEEQVMSSEVKQILLEENDQKSTQKRHHILSMFIK